MSDTAVRTVNGVEYPAPGTYGIDTSHSALEFNVRHMMVGKTRGRFTAWSGAITVADDLSLSSAQLEVDIASIDTRDEGRDAHLRSADFFDAEVHPKMTFTSTKVERDGDDWKVTGDLTIKGITQPVVLDVSYGGVIDKDPFGFTRASFEGSTEIDREAFGLTWNVAMEKGGVLVGKKVKIEFEIEAAKPVA